jgi:hypothetical protein
MTIDPERGRSGSWSEGIFGGEPGHLALPHYGRVAGGFQWEYIRRQSFPGSGLPVAPLAVGGHPTRGWIGLDIGQCLLDIARWSSSSCNASTSPAVMLTRAMCVSHRWSCSFGTGVTAQAWLSFPDGAGRPVHTVFHSSRGRCHQSGLQSPRRRWLRCR